MYVYLRSSAVGACQAGSGLVGGDSAGGRSSFFSSLSTSLFSDFQNIFKIEKIPDIVNFIVDLGLKILARKSPLESRDGGIFNLKLGNLMKIPTWPLERQKELPH